MMETAAEPVIALIFGRWRSRTLAAGTEPEIFDRLGTAKPRRAPERAAE